MVNFRQLHQQYAWFTPLALIVMTLLVVFFMFSTKPTPPKQATPEKEWLVSYCEKKLKEQPVDYFIFGHRHLPIDHTLSNGSSRYINTGDWLTHYSFAEFDGRKLELKKYRP